MLNIKKYKAGISAITLAIKQCHDTIKCSELQILILLNMTVLELVDIRKSNIHW